MSAFATNAMLLAQFPTPAVRAGLWTSLVKKAVAEIRDERWEVLLVAMGMEREREGEGEVEDGGVKGLGKREGEGERERGRGEIVAFAKWFCPRSRSKAIPRAIGIENGVDGTGEGEGYVKNEGEDEEQEYEEAPWVWPEGTDMEILEEWTRRVDAAGEVVMGRRPCYRMYRDTISSFYFLPLLLLLLRFVCLTPACYPFFGYNALSNFRSLSYLSYFSLSVLRFCPHSHGHPSHPIPPYSFPYFFPNHFSLDYLT